MYLTLLSQRSLLRPSQRRFLSTFPSRYPTYHANSDLLHPVLAVAIATVLPYHSLLCHLSRFAVMALFRTSVVFFTFDSLPLFLEEHEEGRETRFMVSKLTDAVSSDSCSHSSLHSSLSSSSAKGRSSRLPFIIHPSISMFTPYLLCV